MSCDSSNIITSLSGSSLIARYGGAPVEAFTAALLEGWTLNDGEDDAGLGTLTAHEAAERHSRGEYVVGDRTPRMQRQAKLDRDRA